MNDCNERTRCTFFSFTDFSTCQLQENVKGNFSCSVIATDLDKDKITYNIEDSQAVGIF